MRVLFRKKKPCSPSSRPCHISRTAWANWSRLSHHAMLHIPLPNVQSLWSWKMKGLARMEYIRFVNRGSETTKCSVRKCYRFLSLKMILWWYTLDYSIHGYCIIFSKNFFFDALREALVTFKRPASEDTEARRLSELSANADKKKYGKAMGKKHLPPLKRHMGATKKRRQRNIQASSYLDIILYLSINDRSWCKQGRSEGITINNGGEKRGKMGAHQKIVKKFRREKPSCITVLSGVSTTDINKGIMAP